MRVVVSGLALALALTACGGGNGGTGSGSASAAASASAMASASAVASASAMASATAASAGAALPDDAVITYHFNDASVPPPYHRSETLVVTKDTSTLTIDSYGDVLATKTVDTPPDVWALLGASTGELTSAPAPQDATGCTGGTGREVQIASGSRNALDLSVEVCGGLNGDLGNVIDAYIAPARALFPATEELAPVKEG